MYGLRMGLFIYGKGDFMKLLRVLKETLISSLPLAVVIVIVCGFVAPMEHTADYLKLLIGYAGVVVGQSLFLVGLDISILPIGKSVGESLAKFKKVLFIVFFGFLFGLLAEAAEPSLAVFARQTHLVMNGISERRTFILPTETHSQSFSGDCLTIVVSSL